VITPRAYASLARVAALVLGVGSLGWSASDPARVRLMLGSCEAQWHQAAPNGCPDQLTGLSWSGCGELVRELVTAGGLLLLAGLPCKSERNG